MPAKIFMKLNNGNYTHAQLAVFKANLTPIPKPKASQALTSSIVGRIHNVRPGCGSCGK